MGGEQRRFSADGVRDLPPKSPHSRRMMPNVPTKYKRGEVRTPFECIDQHDK